ncbi:hypothetical protein [uncultured Salinicola sp.]|uniref:hypothetical protein n=1 Tax=uncultured Salinicola sp. TaxID=1193542 RepID=UPI00261CB7AC|nr:hypothetical protein [uncultured Salinicola sp.]
MSEERIGCCVPDCRRTGKRHPEGAPRPYTEWICARHWSLLTKDERRGWNRHRRQIRKYGQSVRPEACDRIWAILKKRAGA